MFDGVGGNLFDISSLQLVLKFSFLSFEFVSDFEIEPITLFVFVETVAFRLYRADSIMECNTLLALTGRGYIYHGALRAQNSQLPGYRNFGGSD